MEVLVPPCQKNFHLARSSSFQNMLMWTRLNYQPVHWKHGQKTFCHHCSDTWLLLYQFLDYHTEPTTWLLLYHSWGEKIMISQTKTKKVTQKIGTKIIRGKCKSPADILADRSWLFPRPIKTVNPYIQIVNLHGFCRTGRSRRWMVSCFITKYSG